MLGNHVQFDGEGVEFAEDALKFLAQFWMFGLEAGVVGGVVGVGVAEGFDLLHTVRNSGSASK